MARSTLSALILALSMASPAAAANFDGQFDGANSIAGGTGECWGNNPASAVVSGSTITIHTVEYDGTSEPITAQLAGDGSFRAAVPLKSGTAAFTGKVSTRRIVANWKGPACYGTLDMTR